MTKITPFTVVAVAAPITIVPLITQEWLAAVTALHAKAQKELPADKKHMLLPRSPAYFATLLAQKSGVLYGAFQGKHLVGMAAVLYSTNWFMAKQKGLVTCPDKGPVIRSSHGFSSVAVVQALCVLEKGNGIALDLIAATKVWAKQKGCSYLFAQVAQDNACGQKKFRQQKFDLVAEWTAPDATGTPRGKTLLRHKFLAAEF